MRVSTDPKSPFHAPIRDALSDGATLIVFLDGKRINDVLTADEGSGEVVRMARGEHGSVRLAPENPGELLRETLRGRVKIVRRYRSWVAGQH